MTDRNTVPMSQSLATQETIVLPGDTNAHDTLFGGLLMKRIDECAAISARRHCLCPVVTASNDGVHFHQPIQRDDIVTLVSYVCSVGRSSMEVFVKILTEKEDGGKEIAAVSFLTFVALGADGRPTQVPLVEPGSEQEMLLFSEREVRKTARHKKRDETDALIKSLTSQI